MRQTILQMRAKSVDGFAPADINFNFLNPFLLVTCSFNEHQLMVRSFDLLEHGLLPFGARLRRRRRAGIRVVIAHQAATTLPAVVAHS